jgi:two-component system chemotaxis sensor kinase CheA
VALDLAKYRILFLEESAEHLAEIGHALLELEKDPAMVESIDTIFRMAHSIKSMAASLGYDSVTEISHALEDHMEGIRTEGRVADGDALGLLFRGLEGLEEMVAIVAETGESPPPRPDLVASLSAATETTIDKAQAAEPVSVRAGDDPSAVRGSGPDGRTSEPLPADAAELDEELVAVMAALEAESGPKKKLLN